MNPVVLWIAQGFYVGRFPYTPGTLGSVVGLVWLAALLWMNSFWGFCLGALLGLACSVWVCGRAEILLGQTDPGSVVLDEIVAVPLCYAGWLGVVAWRSGQWPAQFLAGSETWVGVAGILLAFRFFDILKPWPVRQSQNLPGGWGVTCDDVLAAVYVNLTVLVILWLRGGSAA